MNQKIKFLYTLLFLITPCALYAAAPNGVVATVNVGPTPAGLAITSDNRFAYVANNNNNGIPNGDSVSVINLATNTVIKTIHDASFNEPYTITINPAETVAYVTNSNGSTITNIDIATNTVVGIINGFDGPSGMVITPDGSRAYVNNYGGPILGSGNGKTISIVDLNAHVIIGSITVDQAPASLAITPDGSLVYVINYVDGNPGTGTISVIRTSDNIVIDTIPGFSGPFAIVIASNGRFAYVTNFGSNNFSPTGSTVSVVDLSTNTISATITVGTQPSGIALTPNDRFAYVTNYNTLYQSPGFNNLTAGPGTVNIIDTCTLQVLCPVITVGSSPANIAIAPDGARAYVSNYSSNTVSVINIVDRMWLR